MEYSSLILVVDDNANGRVVLASLLEPDGYRVVCVDNGHEALRQSRVLAPDLVLLDVMMPEMDGFEVCRRLRADPALALVPVVMVTALDDQSSRLQGIEAGADDFVTKPFNRTELRARVRTITRLNRYRILLEEQRRAASERLRFLWAIEHSLDGYLFLDTDDRPQDGNLKGWSYLGLRGRPDAPPHETFLAIAARSYRLEPAAAWARWPAEVSSPRFLVRPESAGPALWLQVQLLDTGPGAAGGRLLLLQDVTAQIGAQRDVWSFHSFVAHKLRTPVTSLLAGTGLVARHGQESLPPDIAQLAEMAHKGARRLATTVEEIVLYINAPLLVGQGEGYLLSGLPDLLSQIGVSLALPPAALTWGDCPPDLRLALGARSVELVLTELLANAQKFHPCRKPAVSVSVACAGGRMTLAVADDGLTLSPAELEQLLQPYHQIDREFTGEVPGMGLGLAMIAQICWGVGGACRVANRAQGPGVVVELELPLEPSA